MKMRKRVPVFFAIILMLWSGAVFAAGTPVSQTRAVPTPSANNVPMANSSGVINPGWLAPLGSGGYLHCLLDGTCSYDPIITGLANGLSAAYIDWNADPLASESILNKPNWTVVATRAELIAAKDSTNLVIVNAPITLAASIITTCPLQINPSCSITTTGYTLTINGPFQAGDYQVFAGSGTVLGLRHVNAKWWGV